LLKQSCADLVTINAWLEVGAIDRAVFGGGRFSKCELQRAALTFELVKFGLPPSSARDVVWEMEYDLQQIWTEAISNQYKAYAIVIPNKQKKWLVIWCWKLSTEEIDPPPEVILFYPYLTAWPALPMTRNKHANIKAFGIAYLIFSVAPLRIS
jgi:hypothetical protein